MSFSASVTGYPLSITADDPNKLLGVRLRLRDTSRPEDFPSSLYLTGLDDVTEALLHRVLSMSLEDRAALLADIDGPAQEAAE